MSNPLPQPRLKEAQGAGVLASEMDHHHTSFQHCLSSCSCIMPQCHASSSSEEDTAWGAITVTPTAREAGALSAVYTKQI